jgi:hypothetical protein
MRILLVEDVDAHAPDGVEAIRLKAAQTLGKGNVHTVYVNPDNPTPQSYIENRVDPVATIGVVVMIEPNWELAEELMRDPITSRELILHHEPGYAQHALFILGLLMLFKNIARANPDAMLTRFDGQSARYRGTLLDALAEIGVAV